MQHWNLLISWNSETVQIFSKHTYILQGLLKPIHNSQQSHLMPSLSMKGYTNLFLPSKINVWKSQAVFYWPRQEGCSYVFGGIKVNGRPDKYFIVVHTLVSSWLWNHNNGKPFSYSKWSRAQQWRPNLPKCFLKIKDQKGHPAENS